MGSVDLPDQPDGPDRTRHVRDSTAGAPRIRELPDPDERARAYEAMRAYVSAETAEEASPGLQPGEGAQRSGRDQASQLLEPQADREKRPAGERQADRSAESDHRGGDLRPAHGRDAEIAAAIGRARETEPTISSDVRAVEQENRYGGWRLVADEERTGLKAFQREAASRIQVPVGASDVSDYKKKGF